MTCEIHLVENFQWLLLMTLYFDVRFILKRFSVCSIYLIKYTCYNEYNLQKKYEIQWNDFFSKNVYDQIVYTIVMFDGNICIYDFLLLITCTKFRIFVC